MFVTSAEAAQELTVSARQVRRAIDSGRLASTRVGHAHLLSSRAVHAHARTTHRGRPWALRTQEAALDLLSSGVTQAHTGTELSRLKRRIRGMSISALSGQILSERVSLRRRTQRVSDARYPVSIASDLGLSGAGGLGVLVAEHASHVARRARLALDDSGDIAVVEGQQNHRHILEALTLFAWGNAREHTAAEAWLVEQQRLR